MRVPSYSSSPFSTKSVGNSVRTERHPNVPHILNHPANDQLQLSFLGGKRTPSSKSSGANVGSSPRTKRLANSDDKEEIMAVFKKHFGTEPKVNDLVVEPYDAERATFDSSPTEIQKRTDQLTATPLQPGESRILWTFKIYPDAEEAQQAHDSKNQGEYLVDETGNPSVNGASYKEFSNNHYKYSSPITGQPNMLMTVESKHPKGTLYHLEKMSFTYFHQ